jgi:hypothetical protein
MGYLCIFFKLKLFFSSMAEDDDVYNEYLLSISDGKHRICAGKLVTTGYWMGEKRKYNPRHERAIRPFFFALDEEGKPIHKIPMLPSEYAAEHGEGRAAVDPALVKLSRMVAARRTAQR